MSYTNIMKPTTVAEDLKEIQKDIPKIEYTDTELKYRAFLIGRAESANDQRNTPHPEFNDMTYQEYYDSNARAANSYIPPKKNKQDTRVVTGTTEEKGATLLSAILNYNLEPNAIAFDKDDNEVQELGKSMEEMIKKSRELEDYDDRRKLIYKEAMDQGTCYVEEQYVEEKKIRKTLDKKNWNSVVDVSKIKWTQKEVDGFCGCQTRLIRGDKVYLGNIKEFELKLQPYLFLTDLITYAQAKALFGNWDRFKYVPTVVTKSIQPSDSNSSSYRDWTLNETTDGFVEVIKYQDKWANEYMIMLNGVMMLPCGFPLEAISPSGEYSIAKGDIYPNSAFFAISKSIPAKTKVDQETLDEMLKLIVLKTRKSFMPPIANNSGRILSSKIFNPGNIVDKVDASKIQEIGTNTGVTASEFRAFQFIKEIIDQKSVAPVFSGDSQAGSQTATEILEQKKQAMMKIGLVIYGIISLERQLAWLRTSNILANWTKKIDERINPFTNKLEAVYRKITTDTTFPDSTQGKSIIEFSPDAGQFTPEQIMEEENQLSETMQTNVRKTYISPEVANLKLRWYYTITPTEKNTSDLKRILFKQDVADAIQLFGPQSMNMQEIRQEYAQLAGRNPDKFFIKNVPSFPVDAAMGGGDNGGLGAQLNRGLGTAPTGATQTGA